MHDALNVKNALLINTNVKYMTKFGIVATNNYHGYNIIHYNFLWSNAKLILVIKTFVFHDNWVNSN